MNKEAIKKLIDEYTGEDIVSYLSSLLRSHEEIATSVHRLKIRRANAKSNYEDSMLAYDKDEESIQANCRHLDISRDPSALGNDQFDCLCRACGKRWVQNGNA